MSDYTHQYRIGRGLEILLGAFFLASAAFKALDLSAFAAQVSYYGLFEAMPLLKAAATGTVVLEGVVAVLLMSGIRLRGITHAVTAALLLAFSGLVAYAWAFEGLEECGCFGQVVATGPLATLVKNAVLLALTGAVWRLTRTAPEPAGHAVAAPVAAVVVTVVVLAGCVVAGDNAGFFAAQPETAGPFAGFTVETGSETLSLAEGRYLVAMLSATCDHCAEAVEPLNEVALDPDAPPVVALMLGDDDAIAEFGAYTGALFPLARVDDLTFMTLLGKEPPRFYVVENGRPLGHMDTLDADAAQLRALLEAPGEYMDAP
jgi:hypothetical protein